MATTTIRPYVRQYFERNPLKTVWRDELFEYVQSQNEEEVRMQSVLHAVNQLMDDGFSIEIQERAHAWIHIPPKKVKEEAPKTPKRKVFELVHETKGGAMILEDTEGEVVIVKPVEL